MKRLPLFLALFLAAATLSADPTPRLLAKAWPAAHAGGLEDIGNGVGIVFSPDLSVPGNCRFYQAMGFACFDSADWLEILSAIHANNIDDRGRRIRTLILETHGTNGEGLKVQTGKGAKDERSYISVGALQERLGPDGIEYVILSACNSGRLMRPSIYKQLDRWNGDRLFLPATCGIVDASPSFDPARSTITILSPATSRIETTVAASVRELSPAARRLLAAAAKERGLAPPTEFAASDILCQILLRDPHLELVAGAWVDELSREHRSDDESDRLFDRLLVLLDARAR